MSTRGIEVLDAGMLTTVQDRGRWGLAHLGVPRAGAVDARAAGLANTLVGNPPDAALLETTATGCALRAREPMLVAVTGAPGPVSVGSIPAPFGSTMRLAAGQSLHVGAPARGMRSYVAVRGGIDVPPVLGSRATDTLSGLGPAPVRAGDVLAVGRHSPVDAHEFATLRDRRDGPSIADSDAPLSLPLRWGPRDDWFSAGAKDALLSTPYTVTGDSNRVGLRLDGAALERSRDGELASEGLVLGAVQVPPSGQPVVFLADHPTTGGYPVIGVIDASGVSAAAQARPGDAVQFTLAGD